MGNKNSTITKSENNTYMVNRTDLEFLNQTMIDKSQKAVQDVLTKHKTEAAVNNTIRLIGVNFKGSRFVIDQTNDVNVEFTSEVINDITIQIQSNLSNELVNDIQNSVDTNMLADIINKAAENIENGMLNTDIATDNESVTESIQNISINNSTSVNLKNIVNIAINSVINQKVMSECINTSTGKNIFEMSNDTNTNEPVLVDVEGDIIITQQNAVNIVQHCTTTNKIMASITDKLAQITNVKIIEDKKTTTDTKSINEENKTIENKGVGEVAESVGEGAGNIIDKTGTATGNIIDKSGKAASNVISSSMWIIIIIGVAVVIGIVLIIFLVKGFASNTVTTIAEHPELIDKGISAAKEIYGMTPQGTATNVASKILKGGLMQQIPYIV